VNSVGKTTIETFEEPDHLLFVVTRETGWLAIVITCIFLSAFVFFLWPDHKLFVILAILMSLFGWIASFTRGNITRLAVSEREIIARGNLERAFTDTITIDASEVRTIKYFGGREGDPAGLYIYHYIHETCVLPGLYREQAEAIIHRIRQRFPNLEQGDTNPNSFFFFSTDDTITRLNLNS